MTTLAAVHAIEASIWVDEATGDYVLTLKLEFADGNTKEIEKRLSQPSFRLELYKERGEEDSRDSN